MKMPGGDAAIVDRRKLTGYCLNPEHPRGKHKARVFATLGFTAENADELRAVLLKAAASNDAQAAASDQALSGIAPESATFRSCRDCRVYTLFLRRRYRKGTVPEV